MERRTTTKVSEKTIEFGMGKMREMIDKHPEAFDGPDCPECGRPMIGGKSEDGPFCAWGHQ